MKLFVLTANVMGSRYTFTHSIVSISISSSTDLTSYALSSLYKNQYIHEVGLRTVSPTENQLCHTNSYRLGVLIMSMSTSLDMELTGEGHKDKKFIHPFFLVLLMRYICIVLSACFLSIFMLLFLQL